MGENMDNINRAGAPIQGVMSLLLTPFDHNKSIDWQTYEAYVDWQLAQMPHGLFAVCGSSEMKWLTMEERLELAERAVFRAKKVPVVATANLLPDCSRHREELHRMIDTGVSGVVLVPPFGLGREPSRLEAYFGALIEASTVPVFLYEWPQVEPYLISHESFSRLVEYGALGIKDTTCTIEGITSKIQSAPNAVVFQANTAFATDAIRAGAGGLMAITSTSNTDLVVRFWEALVEKDADREAAVLQRELVFLDSLLIRAHPAAAKYITRLRGLDFQLYTRWPVNLEPQVLKAIDIWYHDTIAFGL
jgi:4-hydroxy-tetrahydrodipicolinate synthase